MRKVQPDLTSKLTGLKEIKPTLYDLYAGEYQLGSNVLTVALEGGHMVLRFGNQGSVSLIPESETEFEVEGWDADLVFTKDPESKVIHASFQAPDRDPIPLKKTK
jgi:hypothetical protein